MPYTIIIKDQKAHFSASHFLYDHYKCSRIHGHNYGVVVELSGPLDPLKHYVVDFYEIKQNLRRITDELDHRILIPGKSNEISYKEKESQIIVEAKNKRFEFPKEDVCILPIEATTAELLAKYIYDRLKRSYESYKIAVMVSESEGSIARYEE